MQSVFLKDLLFVQYSLAIHVGRDFRKGPDSVGPAVRKGEDSEKEAWGWNKCFFILFFYLFIFVKNECFVEKGAKEATRKVLSVLLRTFLFCTTCSMVILFGCESNFYSNLKQRKTLKGMHGFVPVCKHTDKISVGDGVGVGWHSERRGCRWHGQWRAGGGICFS